jgi:hypothetical protein
MEPCVLFGSMRHMRRIVCRTLAHETGRWERARTWLPRHGRGRRSGWCAGLASLAPTGVRSHPSTVTNRRWLDAVRRPSALASQLPASFQAYAGGDQATLNRFLALGASVGGAVSFGSIASITVPPGGATRDITVTVTGCRMARSARLHRNCCNLRYVGNR